MILKTIVITFSLLLSHSSATSESVVDFCVADLTLPKGPAGYPCRNPANLTVNDFVFSGLGVEANTSNNLFKFGVTTAFDDTFPAVNDLGLSMARLDLAVGGILPAHTHRVSKIFLLIEGTVIAGFIGSDNTPYYKTLKNKGDIIIFPPSLLHFVVNVGSTTALLYASFNSPNPGLQLTSPSLFGNNLPTEVVRMITLVDAHEVERLKRIFGGTN